MSIKMLIKNNSKSKGNCSKYVNDQKKKTKLSL